MNETLNEISNIKTTAFNNHISQANQSATRSETFISCSSFIENNTANNIVENGAQLITRNEGNIRRAVLNNEPHSFDRRKTNLHSRKHLSNIPFVAENWRQRDPVITVNKANKSITPKVYPLKNREKQQNNNLNNYTFCSHCGEEHARSECDNKEAVQSCANCDSAGMHPKFVNHSPFYHQCTVRQHFITSRRYGTNEALQNDALGKEETE